MSAEHVVGLNPATLNPATISFLSQQPNIDISAMNSMASMPMFQSGMPHMPHMNFVIPPKKKRARQRQREQRTVISTPEMEPKRNFDQNTKAIRCAADITRKGFITRRCKNAALMDLVGSQTFFCAEHVHLDKTCLYGRCKCSYSREVTDGRQCKKIVHKTIGFCDRHIKTEFIDKLSVDSTSLTALESVFGVANNIFTTISHELTILEGVDELGFQRKQKQLPLYEKLTDLLGSELKNLRELLELKENNDCVLELK
ncbi:hypothetical protein PCE1_000846 [Barthelona sp. PCE]